MKVDLDELERRSRHGATERNMLLLGELPALITELRAARKVIKVVKPDGIGTTSFTEIARWQGYDERAAELDQALAEYDKVVGDD